MDAIQKAGAYEWARAVSFGDQWSTEKEKADKALKALVKHITKLENRNK